MKIIKNPIFTFILGALICGTTGVVASTLMASNVAYTPKDSTWGVNNVEAAIDSLKLSKTSDNYSTEEKVIGTWIDGKPLYQKTVVIPNNVDFTNNKEFDVGIVNGDMSMILLSYYIDGGVSYPLYYSQSSGANLSIGMNQSNHKLRIKTDNNFSANASRKIVATIQYTKTTD